MESKNALRISGNSAPLSSSKTPQRELKLKTSNSNTKLLNKLSADALLFQKFKKTSSLNPYDIKDLKKIEKLKIPRKYDVLASDTQAADKKIADLFF